MALPAAIDRFDAKQPVPMAMARRRSAGGPPLVLATIVGIGVTVALAGFILLANEVTHLRSEIDELGRQRSGLVARHAGLMARWNTASAHAVIMARATEELGLISPQVPGTVLVLAQPEAAGQDDRWQRVWTAMAAGEAVPTAAAAAQRP